MTLASARSARLRWAHLQVLLPAVLVLFFGFRAGGYFAGTPAFAAALLTVVLAFRVVAARRAVDGASRLTLVAIGALALYTVWVLASALWSDAPGRAQIEFDRALLYLLAIVLLAAAPVPAERLRWAVRAVALAAIVICTAGLISRVLPEWLPTTAAIENERLSYPVTYWNALALIAALAGTLCLHLSASAREPRALRVVAAAAVPIAAATLFFTFSRGGILAAIVAVVAYVAVARGRSLVPALCAVVPPTAVAVKVAYDADLLGSPNEVSDAAVAQGQDVAWVVLACVLGAALLRFAALRLDDRLERVEITPERRRGLRLAGAGAALVAFGVALALGAPGYVSDQYEGFTRGNDVDTKDFRTRLFDPGNNGRLDLWRASLESFEDEPLTGHGAGTFQVLWTQRRPDTETATNGHSLYLETLAELGLPGLLLLVTAIVALLAAALRRARGPDQAVYAAVFAVGLAWALRAGIDWDWEMPAATIGPLALLALASARREASARDDRGRELGQSVRIVGGLACLVLAITPVSIAISQGHLNKAVDAYRHGDCGTAVDSALSASEAAGARPEPFAVLGFCDAKLGQDELAVSALESAVERDPDNWEYRYGLALVRGAQGVDPRPDAAEALRLNPNGLLARRAARGLRTGDAARWRAFARRAPLPIR